MSESMQEKQPILSNLIMSGYGNKLLSLVINEKKHIGVALIKLDSIEQPFNIYWNQAKKHWQDVKPASIIEKHYNTAV